MTCIIMNRGIKDRRARQMEKTLMKHTQILSDLELFSLLWLICCLIHLQNSKKSSRCTISWREIKFYKMCRSGWKMLKVALYCLNITRLWLTAIMENGARNSKRKMGITIIWTKLMFSFRKFLLIYKIMKLRENKL